MINVIINKELLDKKLEEEKEYRFIRLPFKRYETVIAYEGGISKEIKNIIETIEECSVDKDGNVESKFTHTPIGLDKLSEGSKTVIYVYYRTKVEKEKEIINITDCGPNAIEYILKNYQNSNLTLYLGHLELPKDVVCRFQINGETVNSTNEIFE